jgi:uncharacterized protein involved in outer membrane biogenesis
MRALFRLAFRLVILLVLLLVAGVLLRNPIVRGIAQYRLSRQTGLEVTIGKVDIGLLSPRITVENLVVYNSADFGGSPLVEVPELHLEYDRGALFSRLIHFRLVRLNFARGTVVEDKAGRLNLEVLQRQMEKTGGGGGGGSGGGGTNRTPSTHYKFLGVDTLNLTLGHVDFLSMKTPARVDTLNIGLHNRVLTDIKSGADLEGVYLWILLRNGIDVISKDTSNPNNPWPYWRARLAAMSKKQP